MRFSRYFPKLRFFRLLRNYFVDLVNRTFRQSRRYKLNFPVRANAGATGDYQVPFFEYTLVMHALRLRQFLTSHVAVYF